MFNKKREYISGFIESSETYTISPAYEVYGTSVKAKYLCMFEIQNTHMQYTEYKRTKKSFLDVLANVGALFSTFFACFAFVYKYYSRNYNNYYLVSKLFSSTIIKNLEDNNKKAKTKKNIELGKALNVNEEISTDSNKSSVLIDDVNDEKNINVKDGSENIKDIDNEEEINNFENVKFIEFFLNNFNC